MNMTRNVVRVAILSVGIAGALQTSSQQVPDEERKNEILKVEDERIQAHQKHDREALGRIYSDDLVWTFPTGQRFTKAEFVDIIINSRLKPFAVVDGAVKQVTTIQQEDKHVYIFGQTAVVTRYASMRELLDGKPVPFPRRFFNVYVKRGGSWQMVAHHSTPVSSDEHSKQQP